jgi:Domain of unknown function (DUF4826)
MTEPDYDDPKVEDEWLASMRSQVADYLRGQSISHGEIGEVAAWHVAPIVSIWAIESLKSPGWVGWWVICGDLPTDYVSSSESRHPRGALRAICIRWEEIAAYMKRGQAHPTIKMGRPKDWPMLSDLLDRRVSLLREMAADDDSWDYDESEFEGPKL